MSNRTTEVLRWSRTTDGRRILSAMTAAIPIIAVNIVAFSGQFAYLRDHLPVVKPLVILTALTLESIAVWLAWQAHKAQLANDSAARVRLASYVLALGIGAMNYSHFARDWRPTVAALIFGLMSSISPWLWSIHSRRVSRDQLMEQGLIEPHAARLGTNRWTWHPIGALRVARRAAWFGEDRPQRAIDDYMAHGPVRIKAARQDGPARATPAPEMPAPAAPPAPELARQSAPEIEAAPVAQEDAPAQSAPPAPGLHLVPAEHQAAAELTADARVPAGVSDEREAEVAEWLAGLTDEELATATYRGVGRQLDTESDQRRRAIRLLNAERATRAQRITRPDPPAIQNGHGGEPIAPARPFVPGGVPVG